MAPPARTITVALDMSKAFDTINIHTLIRKLLQTMIPGTIIKFIANYIKGRKVFAWTKQNNLTLNPDKTTCTLFPPDPAEYKSNLDLKINNTALPTHGNAPKGSGPYIIPKTHIHHTHSQHHSTSTHATTNDKSTRSNRELPQDAHKTQTYNICMTKHSYFPYTSTYSSTPHNTNRQHNIHHTPYTNIQHTSTLILTLCLLGWARMH